MERPIIFPAIFLLLFFTTVGFASTYTISTATDTYNSTATIGAYSPIVNQSVDHSGYNVLTLAYGSGSNDMWAKMQYDLSGMQDMLIDDVTWNYYPTAACQAINHNKIYYSTNSTWVGDASGDWSDNIISFNESDVLLNSTTGVYHPYSLTKNNVLYSTLYGASDNITLIFYEGSIGCTASQATYNISSVEGGNPAFLNFTLSQYQNGNITTTSPSYIYFDFETGKWNESAFTGFDFQYDVTNNIISPGQPATFYYRFEDATNTSLQWTDCAIVSPAAYTLNNINNINPDQDIGLYDTYCFNLSSDHNGQQFYGAIKIINNAGNVAFYYGVYAPGYNIFSYPTLSPNPPQAGVNLTIQWTTTIEMLGSVKYHYIPESTGNITAWYYAIDTNTSYTQVHRAIINKNQITPGYYEFYLIGNSTDNTNYTSILYAVNVGTNGSVFVNVGENATVPAALDTLTSSGFCNGRSECWYIVTGIMTMIFTGTAFFLGNKKFGILTLIGCITVFGFLGWLPFYVVIPILVLTVIPIVRLITHGLGGR